MLKKLLGPLNQFQRVLSVKAWLISIRSLMTFIDEMHACEAWVVKPEVQVGLSNIDLSVFLHETSVDNGLSFGWWSFLISCMFDFFFIGASFDSTSPSSSFLLRSDVYKASLVFWVTGHLPSLSMGSQLRWSSWSLRCPSKVFLLFCASLTLMEWGLISCPEYSLVFWF